MASNVEKKPFVMRLLCGLLFAAVIFLSGALMHQVKRRQLVETMLARQATPPRESAHTAAAETSRLGGIVEALSHANHHALRAKGAFAPAEPINESSAKVAALKDVLSRLPEQQIPELQFATDADWYGAADGALETVEDYRHAFSKLRAAVEKRFAEKAGPALGAYLQAHQGSFPKEATELRLYFGGSIDEAVLLRYKVVPAREVPNVGVGG